MKVLEIGYGTGELSASLLGWMNNLNAPVEALNRSRIISEYLAIDSAGRMQEVVGKRFAERKSYQMFEVCSAPTWSGTVMYKAPYDVICGSLVLHDMVAGGDVKVTMRDLLGKLDLVTSENSLLIFADVFLSDDEKVKNAQLEKWKKHMRQVGMRDQEIGDFFAGNPELIDTLTINKIDIVVKGSGFSRVDLSPIPGANGSCPFRVLILQKRLSK